MRTRTPANGSKRAYARRRSEPAAVKAVCRAAASNVFQAMADASPQVQAAKDLQAMADGSSRVVALRVPCPERAPASSSAPPIQAAFAPDTTFGLEIEFKNRFVSAYDYGKNLDELPLTEGSLKGWKAGTDRGRGMGGFETTVLEYESRVYDGRDWQVGIVKDEVAAAVGLSKFIAPEVAGKNGISNAFPPGSSAKQPDNDGRDAVDHQKNVDMISARHKEEASATLQITTLGRRSLEHSRALKDTTDDFATKTHEKLQDYAPDTIQIEKNFADAKQEADTQIESLLMIAGAKDPGAETVKEDFRSVMSVMIRSVVLAERKQGGYGTPKNLVDPLARRVIGPPPGGFRERLEIDRTRYVSMLNEYQARLSKLREIAYYHDLKEQFSTLAWLAKGSMDEDTDLALADTYDEKDDSETIDVAIKLSTALNDIEEGQNVTKMPSLWHDIAGSVPTLEDEIIKKAKKPEPEKWTAHEIRNAFLANGMGLQDMKDFLEIMKEHVSVEK